MKKRHVKLTLEFVIECDDYELPYAVVDGARNLLDEGIDIWDDNVIIEDLEELE